MLVISDVLAPNFVRRIEGFGYVSVCDRVQRVSSTSKIAETGGYDIVQRLRPKDNGNLFHRTIKPPDCETTLAGVSALARASGKHHEDCSWRQRMDYLSYVMPSDLWLSALTISCDPLEAKA